MTLLERSRGVPEHVVPMDWRSLRLSANITVGSPPQPGEVIARPGNTHSNVVSLWMPLGVPDVVRVSYAWTVMSVNSQVLASELSKSATWAFRKSSSPDVDIFDTDRVISVTCLAAGQARHIPAFNDETVMLESGMSFLMVWRWARARTLSLQGDHHLQPRPAVNAPSIELTQRDLADSYTHWRRVYL